MTMGPRPRSAAPGVSADMTTTLAADDAQASGVTPSALAQVAQRRSEHEPPAILAQCPRRSSNSQPTIPIARCGSGTESSASPSRHGPLRPDRGGRPTPTTYAWESTIVDPVRAIPLPFRTSPSRICPERSNASANLAARSFTLARNGPYAGTPRAARSRWPPRPQSRNSTGRSLLAHCGSATGQLKCRLSTKRALCADGRQRSPLDAIAGSVLVSCEIVTDRDRGSLAPRVAQRRARYAGRVRQRWQPEGETFI